MAALAPQTRSIGLGTLVTAVGFRYPSIVAKMAATLDVISNGRLNLSLGAGWYEPEYKSYGIPFPPLRQRIEQLREAIQIIRLMWTQDKPTFRGRTFNISEAWCYPRPVQKTPKIWVGGTSEKRLFRVVAELADGWNATGTSPEEYRKKLEVLRTHCEASHRRFSDIELSYYSSSIIGRDEDEIETRFKKYYGRFKRSDETIGEFFERVKTARRSFIGTAEEVIERIHEFAKLGVEYIILYYPDKDATGLVREFGQTILPIFARD